jgi:TP901 family phage tail tape measure protein
MVLGGGQEVSIVIRAVDEFSKTMEGVVGTLEKNRAGFMALAGAGLAITTGLGLAVKTAVDFESAFAGVRKTVDLSEQEFADLNKRFKDLTKEVPFSYIEIAKIGELAGQLGIEGVNNIESFTKVIADISATTNMTSEQASTDFARFANIMGMPIDQVDKLGATIVDLGNNLATTESEIVEMGMRIAGAGNAVGMTESQVMSWAGALSSVGVEAQMGGTAISKFMLDINSMVATGSEDLQQFANIAGMSTDEFSKLFEEDASKALQVFFNGLSEVEKNGGNVAKVIDDLGIKEVRLRDTVMRLASGNEAMNKSLDVGKNAWEENTALTEEAEKRYETFASQIEMLKNNIILLIEPLGRQLFPILKNIVDTVSPLITKVSEWTEEHPELTKWIVILTAAIGGILLVVGTLGLMIPILVAGFTALGTAVGFVTWPILAIIAAIALLIAAVVLIWKHWEELGTKTKILLAILAPFVVLPIAIIKNWDTIKDFFSKLWEAVKIIFKVTWEWIKNMFLNHTPMGLVIKHWDKLKDFFSKLWEAIKIVSKAAWEWIKNMFLKYTAVGLVIKHWDKLKDFFSNMWDSIKNKFKDSINFLIGLAEKLANSWISGANAIIGALNKIQVSIPRWVPGIGGNTFGINLPKVPSISLPRLAEGGIVTRPTTALIGENGPEAIIPLNRDYSGKTINIYIEKINGLTGRDLANSLQKELNKKIKL